MVLFHQGLLLILFSSVSIQNPLIVAITEGIPVLDMIKVKKALENSESRLIGRTAQGSLLRVSVKSELCQALFTCQVE